MLCVAVYFNCCLLLVCSCFGSNLCMTMDCKNTDTDSNHLIGLKSLEQYCTVSFQIFDKSMAVEGEFPLLQRCQLHFPDIIRPPSAGRVQP